MKQEKADKGTVFMPVTYMSVLLWCFVIFYIFWSVQYGIRAGMYMTDCVTDALLGAAALSDEELYNYADKGAMTVSEPAEKYERFVYILRAELGLDDSMLPEEENFLSLVGQVEVSDFIIYSVNGRDITVFDFDASGQWSETVYQESLGNFRAADGMLIEETSFYAEITYHMYFLKQQIPGRIGQLVDLKDDGKQKEAV